MISIPSHTLSRGIQRFGAGKPKAPATTPEQPPVEKPVLRRYGDERTGVEMVPADAKTKNGTPLFYPGQSNFCYGMAAIEYFRNERLLKEDLEPNDKSAQAYIQHQRQKLELEANRLSGKNYKFPGAEYDYVSERFDRQALAKLREKISGCYDAEYGREPRDWKYYRPYEGLSPARAKRAQLLRDHFSNARDLECYIHNMGLFSGDRALAKQMDYPFTGSFASEAETERRRVKIDSLGAFLHDVDNSKPTEAEAKLLAARKAEAEVKLDKLDAELTHTFTKWQAEDKK